MRHTDISKDWPHPTAPRDGVFLWRLGPLEGTPEGE